MAVDPKWPAVRDCPHCGAAAYVRIESIAKAEAAGVAIYHCNECGTTEFNGAHVPPEPAAGPRCPDCRRPVHAVPGPDGPRPMSWGGRPPGGGLELVPHRCHRPGARYGRRRSARGRRGISTGSSEDLTRRMVWRIDHATENDTDRRRGDRRGGGGAVDGILLTDLEARILAVLERYGEVATSFAASCLRAGDRPELERALCDLAAAGVVAVRRAREPIRHGAVLTSEVTYWRLADGAGE